ncbi:hypothetical protein JS756_13545 [Streptomyces actuosus]|uniref:Secreted protein n=1 Tax=Streptomyces actuosus TaxID=1885 RepID=A0ABS2VPV8_STRAS|nr:hypothetical protein [Streptomyces actuosus]
MALAGAVVAGVGFTVVTVRDADRDPGAPIWKFPKAGSAGDDKGGEHAAASARGLGGMLVPYDVDGWTRGPDLGEYGFDAELTGAQAAALRKESLRDLPRTQRKRLEKEIDKQHIKGMAMRSYLSAEGRSGSENEGTYEVSVVLAQMDRAAVRDVVTFQNDVFDALDVFREGPRIKGHEKDAKCFLPPKDTEEELDTMFCSAHIGNVLVTVTADAAKPLDTQGVAAFVREQLDRISEPGEAV